MPRGMQDKGDESAALDKKIAGDDKMRSRALNFINHIAVFAIFSGALSFGNFYFMELRASYLIMFITFILIVPFLGEIYFNRTFLLIFCALSLFSIFNIFIGRDSVALFSKQVVGILLNAFFFYLLIRVNDCDTKRLFRVYLNIAFVVALIGVIQEVSYFLRFEPGYDFHGWLPKWGIVDSIRGNFLRVNSILPEPSFFCIVMMPAFFASMASLSHNGVKLVSGWKSVIVVISVFLAFSSTGYAGFLCAAILLLVNHYRKRYVAAYALLICLLFYMVYNNIYEVRVRIDDSVNVLRGRITLADANPSTNSLFANALVAYNSFKANPAFGSGLGSHKVSYEKYIGDIRGDNSEYVDMINREDAASLFLRLASETGLLGILLFFIFIFKFYISRKRDPTGYLWIISNAVLAMFLLKLLRMGHYFVDGLFFFLWVYYFAKMELKKGAEEPCQALVKRI
jgi:hypothetical protein